MSIRFSRIGRIAIAVVLAASPLRAMQQDSSEARVVITLDSLDRATFANVAELLQARVAGLTITRDGNGGLHWYMRGQSSFSGSAPLVLVDDMRVTTGSFAEELANRPPYLDVIDIETVARVEILSGAATAARYGSGAGHGVIRVVTFPPRAQATAWRLYTAAGALEDDVRYPATYGRPGSLPSGGTTSHSVLSRRRPMVAARRRDRSPRSTRSRRNRRSSARWWRA